MTADPGASKPVSPKAIALGAVLVLAPLGAGVGFLLVRSGGESLVRAGFVADARWRNGTPRILSKASVEGSTRSRTLCTRTASDREIGCGDLRNEQPWDGLFADWVDPPDPAKAEPLLGGVRRFRAGKRHGRWETYLADGSVLVELEYADDKLVGRRVRGADGSLRAMTLPDPLPAGTLPASPDVLRPPRTSP